MTTLGYHSIPDRWVAFRFGKIPESYTDVEDLTESITRKHGYLFSRDSSSEATETVYPHFSLCQKEEKLAETLKRIKKQFSKNNKLKKTR